MAQPPKHGSTHITQQGVSETVSVELYKSSQKMAFSPPPTHTRDVLVSFCCCDQVPWEQDTWGRREAIWRTVPGYGLTLSRNRGRNLAGHVTCRQRQEQKDWNACFPVCLLLSASFLLIPRNEPPMFRSGLPISINNQDNPTDTSTAWSTELFIKTLSRDSRLCPADC